MEWIYTVMARTVFRRFLFLTNAPVSDTKKVRKSKKTEEAEKWLISEAGGRNAQGIRNGKN